jgi:Na+/proline symporter
MLAIIVLTLILSVFGKDYVGSLPLVNDLTSVPVGLIVGFFLFGLFGPFSGPHYYQRIFAASNGKVARFGTWLSSLAILLPGIGLFVIGMAAKKLFIGIDPDLAFLKMIQSGGPTIALIGSLVLWCALMSTVDTITFTASQILNKDVFKKSLSKKMFLLE